VVRDHRPFFEWFFLIKGGVAVIYFYIISGFYMSFVILRKYNKEEHGARNFLLGRALRLYPCYWAVLILTIVARAVTGMPTIYTSALDLNWFERIIALFSNTFIMGLDVVISGAVLKWHDGAGGLDLSWSKMLIMQGWTIGVEITFYIFAIFFIFKGARSRWLAIGLAIYIRVYFLLINGKFLNFSHDGIGYSNTPWGYHFFGIDLIYFMLGYLAYEGYCLLCRWEKTNKIRKIHIYLGTGAVACVLLSLWHHYAALQTILDYNDYRIWVTIPFFVLLIPGLFRLTKDSRLDDYIGLVSYPIYLDHVIATDIGSKVLSPSIPPVWATLISVLSVTLLLVVFVEKPIEAYRRRRSAKAETAANLHLDEK